MKHMMLFEASRHYYSWLFMLY